MKDLTNEEINKWAYTHPNLGDVEPGHGGCYQVDIPMKKGKTSMVNVVASCSPEAEWDHVSVSKTNRCPTWLEMDYIKDLFFDTDEVVMQLHVGKKDHINIHQYCLHLWRPHGQKIPLPPHSYV